MTRETVYQSDTAKVIAVGDFSHPLSCVTFFTFASDESTLPEVKGFGEDILLRLGIPSVHFINLKNHWWQIPDLDECLFAGFQLIEHSKVRVGYGSSMGAYAVLRFSKRLNLDVNLCFSPQFSVNPELVPFEKRWRNQAQALDFSNESMELRTEGKHHIIYDPRCDDVIHVDMIVKTNPSANIHLHPVLAGEHFVIREYQRLGLLTDILKSLQRGDIDDSLIRSHPNYLGAYSRDQVARVLVE